MVVDLRVNRGEFLECFHPPKSEHSPLSSPERLVRILGPVVQPAPALLAIGGGDLLQRGAIGAQAVGHDGAGPTMALSGFLDELQGGGLVSLLVDQGLQDLALVVYGAPEVAHLAID